jgi:hypothetical protein
VTPAGVAAPDAVAGESAADLPPPHAAPDEAAPAAAPAEAAPPGPVDIVRRLQGAVARVLPAIEATLEKLAAGPMPPREMERAGRALSSLTRTLRELKQLLGQYPVPGGDRGPEDDNEFVLELVRRMNHFAARHAAQTAGDQKDEERG